MKGDRVEIVIDAGSGTTKTYEIVATRAGRKRSDPRHLRGPTRGRQRLAGRPAARGQSVGIACPLGAVRGNEG